MMNSLSVFKLPDMIPSLRTIFLEPVPIVSVSGDKDTLLNSTFEFVPTSCGIDILMSAFCCPSKPFSSKDFPSDDIETPVPDLIFSVLFTLNVISDIIFPKLSNIKNKKNKALALVNEFIDLSKRFNLPTKIRELGIPKKACKEMSVEAMRQERLLINNPINMTEDDAHKIYEEAW